MSESKSEVESTGFSFRFSYTSFWEHCWEILSGKPVRLFSFTLGTFAAIWTMLEAASFFLGIRGDSFMGYLLLCAISFAVALLWEVKEYLDTRPEGLEDVSRRAQRIGHIQRPNWEFQLAKALLAERLAPIDRECKDLLSDATFVPALALSSDAAYVTWLQSRFSNLESMLAIGSRIVQSDFPMALSSHNDESASPKQILFAIESLERFYESTVDFERMSRTVLPPEGLERLHTLQQGWSQPIRDAIVQLFKLFHALCEVDARKDSHIKFTVEFEPPDKLNEFEMEFDRKRVILERMLMSGR